MSSMVFHDKIKNARSSRRLTNLSNSNTTKPTYELFTETASETQSLEALMPRTPLLILDYVQYLAARTIQRKWRSYARRLLKGSSNQAAITIQRWWRGYRVRSQFTLFVERKLQNILVRNYNRAATKIQATFRGYMIRQTVHDVSALKKMQNCAAQELLNCVAFKLHHLLRTYAIPGVYSLRESHCLSRVEKLLASLKFRFHNARVTRAMMTRDTTDKNQKRRFLENKYHTTVPYSGPNDKLACKPHCEEFLTRYSDLDNRMYKIIAAYDESQRDAISRRTQYNLAERKRRRRIRLILEQKERHKCDFCASVVSSMCRWQIWDSENLVIAKDVFRNPANLEQFLNEAAEIMDDVQGRCHCKITQYDAVQCH